MNKVLKLKVLLVLLVASFALSGCGGHGTMKNPSGTANQSSESAGEGNSWAKKYSGVAYFNSVQEMPDRGYILAGNTNWWDGSATSDILVLKVNSNGDEEWAKVFGQNGSYNGMPTVQQTRNGGYFVAGITGAYVKGEFRFIIIKFNSKDKEEWAKVYGLGDKTVVSVPINFSVQQASDGGFFVASQVNKSCFILKLSPDGNKEWLEVIAIPKFDSMEQTKDGGCIISGGIGDHPLSVLVKVGKTGDIEWIKKYKVSKWGNEFNNIEQTKDGGYIATSDEFAMNMEIQDSYSLILKLDKYGNKEWEKVFGTAVVCQINSIEQTKDGGYIIVGNRATVYSHNDGSFIVKLNSLGNPEWGE